MHQKSNCRECGIDHISWELQKEIDVINALDIEDKATPISHTQKCIDYNNKFESDTKGECICHD